MQRSIMTAGIETLRELFEEVLMRNRYLVFGIVFGLVTSGSLALAQSTGRGRVSGSVLNTEGKPIEGAAITATREDGESDHILETTSDSDGTWAPSGLSHDKIRVQLHGGRLPIPGFHPERQADRKEPLHGRRPTTTPDPRDRR